MIPQMNTVYRNRRKDQGTTRSGLDIQHIRRENRQGFKAGALKEGLLTAKGDFIAIFDADFLPDSDWLKKTVIYFKDEEIGVVQTRWGHINRDYSTLTKIQAFALDAHFTLEQVGRNSKGHFINFNGTAGIWRKECILDAGNWEGDTLTEDLDLSYRAQLKNWKFKYLEDVETPAEFPVVISAATIATISMEQRWGGELQKIGLECDKCKEHFVQDKISWRDAFIEQFNVLVCFYRLFLKYSSNVYQGNISSIRLGVQCVEFLCSKYYNTFYLLLVHL